MIRSACRLNAIAMGWLIVASPLPAEVPPQSDQLPNAMGQVSQRLLNHLLQMAIERQVNITDNVLGTSVRGTVNTQGHVIPLLVPNSQGGTVELRFTGTTTSPRMIGQNGPATIVSSARSQVTVRKQIRLDDRGLHLQPAVASVNTQLNIGNVVADRRFVERIARRRAQKSQAEARAITSQRTRSRLQQEVDHDAAKPLAQAQDYFEKGFREPLLQRQSLPKFLRFSTTPDYLRLALRQCSRSDWPAPTTVPTNDPDHDIAIALHQSSICSIYEVFIAGQTVHDRDVLHTLHLLTGEDPRPLRVHARTPAWSMRMADHHPLSLLFEDNTAAIGLHLKSVQHGPKEYVGSFSISVRFKLRNADGAPRLERLGEVQVEGVLDNNSPGELNEALSILRSKFEAVFQSSFAFEGLVPPTGGVWGKIRVLELKELRAQDGWLIVGYRLPSPKKLEEPTARRGTGHPMSDRHVDAFGIADQFSEAVIITALGADG